MAYRQCRSFHVSSIHLILSICSHVGTSEWFTTSVTSCMLLQATFLRKCLFTLEAVKCLTIFNLGHFFSVDPEMFLQITWSWAFVITLGAAERLITSVGSFMNLQTTWCWAFVVTLGAAEWFITSVGSFMNLQITVSWVFVIAMWAAKWFFSRMYS